MWSLKHVIIDMTQGSHKNVVWLYVGVKNATAFHQFQSEKQLLSVWAYSLDMKTNVFAVLL